MRSRQRWAAILVAGALLVPATATAMIWKVSRVITGETLIASEDIIRLRGIIAPNVEAAREHLAEMVEGDEIWLPLPRGRDNNGRTWCNVMNDGEDSDVGARMIADGYALADPSYPHERSEEYPRLEIEARRDGRGLWADSTRRSLADAVIAADTAGTTLLPPRARTNELWTADSSFVVHISHVYYHLPGCWALFYPGHQTTLGDLARGGNVHPPCGMCHPPVLDTTSTGK